jgi:Cu(I)/Ag(I) efflux system membrane protein CusA/SilA
MQTASIVQGSHRRVVRVMFPPDQRADAAAIRRIRLPARKVKGSDSSPMPSTPTAINEERVSHDDQAASDQLERSAAWVTLDQIAEIKITDGPATIKGENGLLRNYVRLNVNGRDALDFVAEAQKIVAEKVQLPNGVLLEWTGQFEHQERARRTLAVVLPIVILLIFAILYVTYRDYADALLMLMAVPGAIAGGLLAQWFLDYKFSVTVWVGYIACFGMATSTGIIMLVYLRHAIDEVGGLERISLQELRDAVVRGAVHRLRPKLLTEATTLIGLVPMLWATGVGAEIIRPMAAPVIGGILVADEVIDLFIPVVFYWVRRARWMKLHQSEPATPTEGRSSILVEHSP